MPIRVRVNGELLELICDDLEGASSGEVEEDDLLIKGMGKRAGVEAPLLDLTEFIDTLLPEGNIEPRGQIGHRVLIVKANIRAGLKNRGWKEKVLCVLEVSRLIGTGRQQLWQLAKGL